MESWKIITTFDYKCIEIAFSIVVPMGFLCIDVGTEIFFFLEIWDQSASSVDYVRPIVTWHDFLFVTFSPGFLVIRIFVMDLGFCLKFQIFTFDF